MIIFLDLAAYLYADVTMIADTLITDEVWSEAPDDPQEAFLFIALSAYERLKGLAADDTTLGQHDYVAWRRQYIWEISALASELGISGLSKPEAAVQDNQNMAAFDAQLALALTRIKASQRGNLRADTVALSYQTKEDIRHHLDELRAKINASNLSVAAQAALHKKIDAVEAELEKKRSSMRPVWLLAGAIAAATPPAVGSLADLPDALRTVQDMMASVHADKAEEDHQEQRLERRPAIEHSPILQIVDQTDHGSKS